MNAALKTSLITIPASQLPERGAPILGGFFTDIVVINGVKQGFVTAPAAFTLKGAYGMYGTRIAADHIADGLANTIAMAEAGSDLAKQVLALEIEGGDAGQWAIPARDQQECQHFVFKPTAGENYCWFRDGENLSTDPIRHKYTPDFPAQTSIEAFREGGPEAFKNAWYWSSTQSSANYSIVQSFGDGTQSYTSKSPEFEIRPVRGFLIDFSL